MVFHSKYSEGAFENKSRFYGRMILLCFVLLLGSFSLGVVAQTENYGWEKRENDVNLNLNSGALIDNQTLLIVGDDGKVMFSGNSGYNLTEVNIGTDENLNDVDCLDTVCFVGGENGVIFRQLESSNWEDISPDGANGDINSIEIIDAINQNAIIVVAVTNLGEIYLTSDSGETWDEINSGLETSLNDIDFFNQTMGLIVGDGGVILGSLDGGASWGLRDVPLEVEERDINGVVFDSAVRAYVVGDEGLFLRSAIGDNPIIGFVWEIWDTESLIDFNSIDSSSVNRVWLVGGNGSILMTKDGGNSFTTQVYNTSQGVNKLNKVMIFNTDIGYIIGDGSTLLYSNSGGEGESNSISVKNYDDPIVYLEMAFPILLEGFFGMLKIIFFSMILGFVLGISFAICKTSSVTFLKIFGTVYTDFFRNTPLLVQILLIHFGLVEVGVDLTFGGNIERAVMSSILSLGVNSGAYQAEIIRSGILAIPSGQMEAGRSIGLSYIDTMRYVILPQAIRIVIPPLGNEFVNLTLNSSLASLTGLFELVRGGRIIVAATFKTFQTWIFVALFYFVVTFSLTNLLRYAENKTKIPGLGLGGE